MVKQGTRVLVTGGAGFIGTHLTRGLCALGCQVRVLDDLSTGRRDRLRPLGHGFELVQADVRNPIAVTRAAHGADAIIHLAAAPGGAEAGRSEEVNLRGALNVLEAARRAEAETRPRVVLCGTGAVYGKQPAFVLHEELAPHPLVPEAICAAAVEQYGRVFHDLYGLRVINLRIFRTFGAEEDADRPDAGVVARFIRAALDGTSPLILGDGHQTRDLVYVDNVVSAITAALEADCGPEPLNIASGEAVAINYLWRLVLDLCGKRRLAIDPTYVPADSPQALHVRPQISRACRVLAWAPSIRMRDGVMRTVNHHLRQRTTDPNAWFAPPEPASAGEAHAGRRPDLPARDRRRAPGGGAPPVVVRPPPVPVAALSASREEPPELPADDLVEDPAIPETEIEWAPVPALSDLVRS
jgi:nucleoside-diphosphate-sugar epimerase